MNMLDYMLLAALAVGIVLALRGSLGTGKKGCGGSCPGCSGCSSRCKGSAKFKEKL